MNQEQLPYAVFIGMQETVNGKPAIPLYNIVGGSRDKAIVSAETLRKEGIEVPKPKI